MRRALFILAVALPGCSIPEFHYPPGPPVIESFTTSRFELPPGESAELSWRVSGANTVELRTPSETFAVDSSGSRSLVLLDRMTVELFATGDGGSSSALLELLVRDPREVEIVFFEVVPLDPGPNEPIQMIWDTANATNVSLSLDNGQIILNSAPTRASFVYRSSESFTVELRAEGFNGPKFATRSITVRPRPPYIVQLETIPAVIYGNESSELAWNIERASTVFIKQRLDSGEESTIFAGPASFGGGRFTLSGAGGSRTITLTARGPGGEVQETTRLVVQPPRPPEILELTLDPDINGPLGETQLRYATRWADDVRLEVGFESISVPAQGSFRWSFLETTTVRLTARATGVGTEAVEERVMTIDQARPMVDVSAVPADIEPGQTTQLSYNAFRADTVRVYTEAGAEIFASAEPSSSFLYTPNTPGSLFIAAENSAGVTVRRVPVNVLPPPAILELTVPPFSRSGRPSRISWRTQNAVSGAIVVGDFPPFPISDAAQIAAGSTPAFFGSFGPANVQLFASSIVSTATAIAQTQVLPRADSGIEEEPNDEQASANGPFGGADISVFGSLQPDDRDLYVITHGPAFRVRATVDGLDNCTQDALIDVYEEDTIFDTFELLATTPAESCQNVDPRDFDIAGLRESTVFGIRALPGQTGALDYALHFQLEVGFCGDGIVDREEQCDDGNLSPRDGCNNCALEGIEEREPNMFAGEAVVLQLDTVHTAFLNDGDLDFFTFQLFPENAGAVRIVVQPLFATECPRMRLTFFQQDQSVVERESQSGCPVLEGPEMQLEPGVYTFAVSNGRGASRDVRGAYTLLVDAP